MATMKTPFLSLHLSITIVGASIRTSTGTTQQANICLVLKLGGTVFEKAQQNVCSKFKIRCCRRWEISCECCVIYGTGQGLIGCIVDWRRARQPMRAAKIIMQIYHQNLLLLCCGTGQDSPCDWYTSSITIKRFFGCFWFVCPSDYQLLYFIC